MSKTKIEWCDRVANPVVGCSKCSPGCDNCYAERFAARMVRPCILAGAGPGDTVIDPFFGSGTTGLVARNLGRRWLGIELNPDYCALALRRIKVNEPRLADMLLEVAP